MKTFISDAFVFSFAKFCAGLKFRGAMVSQQGKNVTFFAVVSPPLVAKGEHVPAP
jgi:hypothetical protein